MRHRNYVLAILFLVYVFNNTDVLAIGLVLQDIKRDFSLTDTQLGLLTGMAFALMYSIAGIAIARWADRGDRVAIISLATAVWSVLVSACGMAVNFVQLFLLRVGVGIGEAGCIPTSQSLIADYFDRADRPRANAVYSMAAGGACLMGYGLAGWLNERYGWRMMFIILGLPGFILAPLAWLTLKEPRFKRSNTDESNSPFAAGALPNTAEGALACPGLKETAATLWSNTTLRHVLLAMSLFTFFGTAISQWQPAFFVRSHGLKTGELGVSLGVIYGLGCSGGAYLGGLWASRYAVSAEHLQLRVAAGANGALLILSGFIYLVPDYHLAFVLVGLYAALGNLFIGSVFAVIQTLTPERMRATAMAILFFVMNLIGVGLGSLVTGALSDALHKKLGGESLRYALLTVSVGFLWSAWHYWQASKSVTSDLAALPEMSHPLLAPRHAAVSEASVFGDSQ